MTETKEIIIKFILANQHCLAYRDFLLDIFCATEKTKVVHENGDNVISCLREPYIGKLVSFEDDVYAVKKYEKIRAKTYKVELLDLNIKDSPSDPYLVASDGFVLMEGIIDNYKKGDAIKTTIGRFVLNYIVLVRSFGDTIPYINDMWTDKQLTTAIVDLALEEKVLPAQLAKYTANSYFIGNQTLVLGVPTFGERSITTHPDIKKERDKLIAEHADALAKKDPVAMSRIEQKLIDMDKSYVNEDEDARVYHGNNSKSFDIHRKTLFLTGGAVEPYGKDTNYAFVRNSLDDGLDKKDIAVINNNARKGTIGRALETQVGGVAAKNFIRGGQNIRIVMHDCKTKVTIPTYISPGSKGIRGRYIKNQYGKIEKVSRAGAKALFATTVELRSPLGCIAKNGFCEICMGDIFVLLKQRALVMRYAELSAAFLKMSLKGMHGSKISRVNIANLDVFAH